MLFENTETNLSFLEKTKLALLLQRCAKRWGTEHELLVRAVLNDEVQEFYNKNSDDIYFPDEDNSACLYIRNLIPFIRGKDLKYIVDIRAINLFESYSIILEALNRDNPDLLNAVQDIVFFKKTGSFPWHVVQIAHHISETSGPNTKRNEKFLKEYIIQFSKEVSATSLMASTVSLAASQNYTNLVTWMYLKNFINIYYIKQATGILGHIRDLEAANPAQILLKDIISGSLSAHKILHMESQRNSPDFSILN
jgi:hypothetical protein